MKCWIVNVCLKTDLKNKKKEGSKIRWNQGWIGWRKVLDQVRSSLVNYFIRIPIIYGTCCSYSSWGQGSILGINDLKADGSCFSLSQWTYGSGLLLWVQSFFISVNGYLTISCHSTWVKRNQSWLDPRLNWEDPLDLMSQSNSIFTLEHIGQRPTRPMSQLSFPGSRYQ